MLSEGWHRRKLVVESWTRGAGWERHHPAEHVGSLLPLTACHPTLIPAMGTRNEPALAPGENLPVRSSLPAPAPRWRAKVGETDGSWVSFLVALVKG